MGFFLSWSPTCGITSGRRVLQEVADPLTLREDGGRGLQRGAGAADSVTEVRRLLAQGPEGETVGSPLSGEGCRGDDSSECEGLSVPASCPSLGKGLLDGSEGG